MRKKLDNISHGKPSAEPSSLEASQSSNSANIRTDVEETKQKLNALAEKWSGVNSVKGFLQIKKLLDLAHVNDCSCHIPLPFLNTAKLGDLT